MASASPWIASTDTGSSPGQAPAEVHARHGRDGREPVAGLAAEDRAHARAHKTAGHPSPTSTEAVKAVWRGIRKTFGTAVAKKLALEVDDVRGHDAPPGWQPRDVRDRALLLVGWWGALRRGELVGPWRWRTWPPWPKAWRSPSAGPGGGGQGAGAAVAGDPACYWGQAGAVFAARRWCCCRFSVHRADGARQCLDQVPVAASSYLWVKPRRVEGCQSK
jgi:hypothetical protein